MLATLCLWVVGGTTVGMPAYNAFDWRASANTRALVRLPEFKPFLYQVLAVQSWAGYLTSLSPGFLT